MSQDIIIEDTQEDQIAQDFEDAEGELDRFDKWLRTTHESKKRKRSQDSNTAHTDDEPTRKKQKQPNGSPSANPISTNWFFTWNGYQKADNESVKDIIAMNRLTKYAIQEEHGENGNDHLQGQLQFRRPMSFKWLKQQLPSVHWEVTRNLIGAIRYCQDKRKRNGHSWIQGWKWGIDIGLVSVPVKDPLEDKTLYRYQTWIINKIQEEPDERTIYWLYSSKGRIGKSSLTKHLCLKHNAMLIGGTFKDAFYALAERQKAKNVPTVIIFDIPRNQGSKVSYNAMEGIKNGNFFSQKYECRPVLMNPPHVFIFANEAPDTTALSADRWKIFCLDGQQDLRDIPDQEMVKINYNFSF